MAQKPKIGKRYKEGKNLHWKGSWLAATVKNSALQKNISCIHGCHV